MGHFSFSVKSYPDQWPWRNLKGSEIQRNKINSQLEIKRKDLSLQLLLNTGSTACHLQNQYSQMVETKDAFNLECWISGEMVDSASSQNHF